jgi:hypothetical protein
LSAGHRLRGNGSVARWSWRSGLVLVALAAALALRVDARAAQSVTVRTAGNALHVSAPGFRILADETLGRLKDGRSLRLDLELAVLARPGGRVVTRSGHTFNLSYDLWEERFAIARLGTPPRSVSHLTQSDAERWCLAQVSVPRTAMDDVGRDEPFWVRLRYRVVDPDEREPSENGPFTLFGLIDRLSRRQVANDLEGSAEAGPFRLSD